MYDLLHALKATFLVVRRSVFVRVVAGEIVLTLGALAHRTGK